MTWATPVSVQHSNNHTLDKLSRLPQVFEYNQGQFDTQFKYIAHTPDTFFSFARDRVNLVLNTKNKISSKLSMRFVGASKKTDISGLSQSKKKVNYLRGAPAQWMQNIPTFSKIEYSELYPGIDLQFYFNQTQMEFDFIVSAGKDPKEISFEIENADAVEITPAGELKISLNGETLIQKAPMIYQQIGGKRFVVEGSYKQQENLISFNIGSYNSKYSLVIDPIIEFSSYFGGQWEDQANVIRADKQGNIFIAGATSARARITVNNILNAENTALPVQTDTNTGAIFQANHGISLDSDVLGGALLDLVDDKKITVVNGISQRVDFEYKCDYEYRGFFNNDRLVIDYDAFVSKFDKDFNPVFTTYFGGCRNDSIRAMTIDGNNNVYVTGITLSTDFPVKFPAKATLAPSRFADDPIQGDAFYAKFDNDGALIYASYLGGDGQDGGRDIAVDENENIYLIGYTHSRNLPTTPCPAAGTRVIACDNIGGIDTAANDAGSTDISVFSDAFVAKISAEGDVISFLTYFGGRFDDWGQSILLHDGAIYISGNTASDDLPVGESGTYSYMPYNLNRTKDEIVENRQDLFCTRLHEEALTTLQFSDSHVCQDVFLAKLKIDGSQVIFSTYFGGDDDDNVSQIAIDSLGNIYMIGTTKSKGARSTSSAPPVIDEEDLLEVRFPLYKNIDQYVFDVNSIVTSSFVTVFKPGADGLILSSFVGGDNDDTGNALAIKENPPNGDGETLVDVYLAGHTLSENFYTLNAFQSNTAQSDIYLVKLVLNQSKINDPYDFSPPYDPNLCSKNGCNLYEIKYSTLLGGEGLDSLKSMTILPDGGGVTLAGVTFSTLFPVTTNAIKKTIQGVNQIEYDPFSRDIVDQFIFYPSDMMLLKVSDGNEAADMRLSLSVANENDVTEQQQIKYSLVIENKSTTTTAKSVRLLLKYAYVARLESISNYLITNLSNCKIDIKQMYCVIGDLQPLEKRTVSLSILTVNSGNFPLSASISSMSSDPNTANNVAEKTVKVKIKPDAASLSQFFLWFLSVFSIWRLISSRNHCYAQDLSK